MIDLVLLKKALNHKLRPEEYQPPWKSYPGRSYKGEQMLLKAALTDNKKESSQSMLPIYLVNEQKRQDACVNPRSNTGALYANIVYAL